MIENEVGQTDRERPRRWEGPLAGGVVFVAFGAVAQGTLALSDPVGQGAAFFPAAGVSLAALLLLPRRLWGWVLGGVATAELLGNLVHGYPLLSCVLWAAANTVEPLVGATLVRRFVPGGRYLVPLRSTFVFLCAGVVAAPVVGGAVGAVGTTLVSDHSFTFVWAKWAVGDALGVLVVAPVLLSWREARPRTAGAERLAVTAGLVVALVVLLLTDDSQWELSVPYLTVPFLTWTALRHGVRATTWAIALTTQVAHLGTMRGLGPFAALAGSDPHALTSFQGYLALTAATTLILAALADDLAHRREFEVVLRRMALHDALTGLPNRASLDDYLDSPRHEGGATVLAVDVDNFKLVNDALGHQVGDDFLVELVARMRAALPADGLLARLSGDEFVAVLPGCAGGDADGVAAALVAAVAKPLKVGDGAVLAPSVSVGMACWVPDDDPRVVLRDADAALYEAKGRGRGAVHRFDQDLRRRVTDRMAVESDLAAALVDGGITCAFQPQFDIGDGRVVGVEALARWSHPGRGAIPPESFVAVAESAGRASDLFTCVLRQSLAAAAMWAEALDDPPLLAVNASVLTLADRSLPDRLGAELEAAGLTADRLAIEVTESGLADVTVLTTLARLHEMGIALAIDDFGTGWSSMARLAAFPWDALKVDRSFVGQLGCDRGVDQVVEATIGLAHSLGLMAVAEGVERPHQLDQLRAMGCDVVQGFLTARPGDATAVVDIVRAGRALPVPAGADRRPPS